MNEQIRPRGAYFRARHAPDLSTFAGTLMTRVAAAVDTRESLLSAFTTVAGEMRHHFPDEPALSPQEVDELVDEVIREHNELVPQASPQALALLDALDALQAAGIAATFAEGRDDAEALQAVGRLARTMSEQAEPSGVSEAPVGYCYSDAMDAAELILAGHLPITYGVFAQGGQEASTVGARIIDVLGAAGLEIQQHDADQQQLLVGPLLYEVPYHGHGLEHIAPPEEDRRGHSQPINHQLPQARG